MDLRGDQGAINIYEKRHSHELVAQHVDVVFQVLSRGEHGRNVVDVADEHTDVVVLKEKRDYISDASLKAVVFEVEFSFENFVEFGSSDICVGAPPDTRHVSDFANIVISGAI